MARPRSTEPFHPDFSGRRTCPQCRITKDVTPENWTARKVLHTYVDPAGPDPYDPIIVTEMVRAPTVYCRVCVNANMANNRLARKIIASAPDASTRARWEAMRKGPCEICGGGAKQRAALARFGELLVVCSQCKHLLLTAEQSGDALAYAREQSSIMTRHCLDEVRIANAVRARTDLDHVPAHKFNPDVTMPVFSHLVCVSLELSWRKIRLWLERYEGVGVVEGVERVDDRS